MPLITRSIPNLIGGVSQQPEILRLENQATAQENGFSGVVEGLKKRPPTKHIAKISSSSLSNKSGTSPELRMQLMSSKNDSCNAKLVFCK